MHVQKRTWNSLELEKQRDRNKQVRYLFKQEHELEEQDICEWFLTDANPLIKYTFYCNK